MATTEPAGPGSELQEYTVRDLADGSPRPGFRLRVPSPADPPCERVESDGPRRVASTDEFGRLRLPPEDRRRVQAAEDDWYAVPDASADDVCEIWVYRRLQVTGEVVVECRQGDAVPPPTDVVLDATVVAPRGAAGAGTPAHCAWVFPLAATLGLDRASCGRPRPDGQFEVFVPRIPGVTLRATLPGWRPTWATLPIEDEAPRVRLRLRPVVRVCGRLVDAVGTPISGGIVAAHATVRGGFSDLNSGELRLYDGASTAAISEGEDWADSTVIGGVTTTASGAFDVPVERGGDILVMVWRPGYRPVRLHVGWNDDHVDLGDVVVSSAVGTRRVRILAALRPLSNSCVTIADVTAVHPQPSVGPIRADADGAISGDWFESGRRYCLALRDTGLPASREPVIGFITWAGQREIDIETGLERRR